MFSTYRTRRHVRKAHRKEARMLKKMRIHAFKQGKTVCTRGAVLLLALKYGFIWSMLLGVIFCPGRTNIHDRRYFPSPS